jgi:hypothetical protein
MLMAPAVTMNLVTAPRTTVFGFGCHSSAAYNIMAVQNEHEALGMVEGALRVLNINSI